jgi:precorrin-6x reductase
LTLKPDNPQVISLDSFNTLLASDYLHQQRVLLTIGYKALHLFCSWQERSTLFARILPAVKSLEAATAAGFASDRIIALRPPVTAELEKALWRHWDISLVVTKASGVAGGEDVKRSVAAELGIPLIVIARPTMTIHSKPASCQWHWSSAEVMLRRRLFPAEGSKPALRAYRKNRFKMTKYLYSSAFICVHLWF